jgi:hypothetical protein
MIIGLVLAVGDSYLPHILRALHQSVATEAVQLSAENGHARLVPDIASGLSNLAWYPVPTGTAPVVGFGQALQP